MNRLAVALAALSLAASLFAAEPVATPPTLPDGVLGIVEFPNLTQFQANALAYAEAVKPGMGKLPLSGPLFLKMGCSTDVAALDAARPLRLLLVRGAPGQVAVVRAFTVKDAEAYRKGLLPTITPAPQAEQAGTPPGVQRYYQQDRTFDREAFQKATAEERRQIESFIKEVRNPLALGVRGNLVCIAPDAAAVGLALDALSQGDAAAKAMLPAHDVSAFLDTQQLMAQLKTEKGSPLRMLREKLAAQLEAAGQPPATKAMLDAELDALDTLALQTRTLSGGLDVTASEIKASVTVAALPGTTLAKYTASVPAGLPDSLKYIPQDCWVVAALRLGDMDPLLDWSAQFQKRIALAIGRTPEEAEKSAALNQKLRGCYGDQCVMGLRSGPGLRVIEAIRLANLQAPAIVQEQISQMGPEMFGGMTDVKMTVAEPVQHNGRTIGEWRLSFGAPAAPDAPADPIKEMQRAMLVQLFGETLTVNHTLLGNDWLISAGPDSLKSLKNVLDEEAPPVTQLQSFKDIVAALPPETQGIVLVHLADAVNQMIPLMRQVAGGLPGALERFASFRRGPGVLATLTGAPDGFGLTLNLPSAELRALLDALNPAAPVAERPKGCMQNMQQIGKAIFAYQENHDGAMPDSLGKLAPEFIADPIMLHCPDAPGAANEYDYAGALPAALVGALPGQGADLIVACDRPGYHPGGRNALFADGHIIFMGEKQFLETLVKNMEELRKASAAKGIALPEAARKFYGG